MDNYFTEELDYSKLKYVLYARKSTSDESRQVRSISDQIKECKDLANRLNLKVIGEPLVETKSAKRPNQRPIFKQILADIRKGRYDSILAWNPDRLARNMLEGGEVIDMIDEGIIRDLKFVTHHFTKDANGKMLLGMAFVLSKQYSDDLSQKVTRGVRSALSEGKSAGTPKHGYLRKENGVYEPDGKNFELIKAAWEMRSKGVSIEEISDFLNKNGYQRVIEHSGRIVNMSPQIMSSIFKDSFYYGVLVQTNQSVDLRAIYDFTPAVTEEGYIAVQRLNYRRVRPSKPHKQAFYPLRGMVLCSFCDHEMVVGPSKSSTGKKFLYYRCDNEKCNRQKKSIRAKDVFNFVYEFLTDGLNLTEVEYKDYFDNLTNITEETRQKKRQELHSRQAVLKHIQTEIKDRSLSLIKLPSDSRVFKENESKISELESEETELKAEISKFESELRDPDIDQLSIEQFLNLSKNAALVVQSADSRIKDIICREIFLNVTVNEEKVLSYQLKEPFATLLKQRQLLSGRGDTI